MFRLIQKFKKLSITTIFLFAVTPLYAQVVPSVQIVDENNAVVSDKSDSYSAYDIIYLQAQATNIPPNAVSTLYRWSILKDGHPKRFSHIPGNNSQILFSAGKGGTELTVTLTLDCVVQEKKKLQVLDPDNKPLQGVKVVVEGTTAPITDLVVNTSTITSPPAQIHIQVETPAPAPAPNPPAPAPGPIPTPSPLTPGKYGLAQKTYNIVVATVPAANRSKASALATSYNTVATKIQTSLTKQAAGVALTADDQALDVQSILKSIQASNTAALGADVANWAQWNAQYKTAIYTLYQNKSINTPQDWVTAFQETAQGLQAVK